MSHISLDELDPGIRDVVAWLGTTWPTFCTTDSGDGESKFAAGWTEEDGALPFPHVFMDVRDRDLKRAADMLRANLVAAGVKVEPGMIQASYDPVDGSCVLALYHVKEIPGFKASPHGMVPDGGGE